LGQARPEIFNIIYLYRFNIVTQFCEFILNAFCILLLQYYIVPMYNYESKGHFKFEQLETYKIYASMFGELSLMYLMRGSLCNNFSCIINFSTEFFAFSFDFLTSLEIISVYLPSYSDRLPQYFCLGHCLRPCNCNFPFQVK